MFISTILCLSFIFDGKNNCEKNVCFYSKFIRDRSILKNKYNHPFDYSKLNENKHKTTNLYGTSEYITLKYAYNLHNEYNSKIYNICSKHYFNLKTLMLLYKQSNDIILLCYKNRNRMLREIENNLYLYIYASIDYNQLELEISNYIKNISDKVISNERGLKYIREIIGRIDDKYYEDINRLIARSIRLYSCNVDDKKYIISQNTEVAYIEYDRDRVIDIRLELKNVKSDMRVEEYKNRLRIGRDQIFNELLTGETGDSSLVMMFMEKGGSTIEQEKEPEKEGVEEKKSTFYRHLERDIEIVKANPLVVVFSVIAAALVVVFLVLALLKKRRRVVENSNRK